jgi:hypothetical protein
MCFTWSGNGPRWSDCGLIACRKRGGFKAVAEIWPLKCRRRVGQVSKPFLMVRV